MRHHRRSSLWLTQRYPPAKWEQLWSANANAEPTVSLTTQTKTVNASPARAVLSPGRKYSYAEKDAVHYAKESRKQLGSMTVDLLYLEATVR